MELTTSQVCGRTWSITLPGTTIAYYRLTDHDIILFDSGSLLQGELETWIEEQGFHVRAILNSHMHWDHVAANASLQHTHGARIYMPVLEAALKEIEFGRQMTCDVEHPYIQQFSEVFRFQVDEKIGARDETILVEEVHFQVIHTPGHSADHVAYITPDDVMYAGDTLMTADLLPGTKFSYAANYALDIESKEKLRAYHCKAYVMAHCGVTDEIDSLITENVEYVLQRAQYLWSLIDHPMSMEEIICRVWDDLHIQDGDLFKVMEIEKIIHNLVVYLMSCGKVEILSRGGISCYARC